MKTASEHFTQAAKSTASVDKKCYRKKDTSERRNCDKSGAPWPSGPPSLLLRECSPQKGHCTVTAAQRRAQCQQGKSWLLEPLLPKRAGVSGTISWEQGGSVQSSPKETSDYIPAHTSALLGCEHPRQGPPLPDLHTIIANLMTCTHPCTSLKTLLGPHSP